MATYYRIHNQVLENIFLSDTSPTPESGEVYLTRDSVGNKVQGQIYLTSSQTWLPKLDGWFSFEQDKTAYLLGSSESLDLGFSGSVINSSSLSMTLSHNRDVDSLSIGDIYCDNGTISNFSTTSNKASFTLTLKDEITGSNDLPEIILKTTKNAIGVEYKEVADETEINFYYTGSDFW